MNRKLLKQKDYALLMGGHFVSLLGSNIQQFVLSLYVLDLTGSATVFASMLAIAILPRLILSPVAGVFGDWFDRKKMIVMLDFVNALLLLLFALYLVGFGSFPLLAVYLLVILLEASEIFFGASLQAIIPSIVEPEDRVAANSFHTLLTSIAQLLSPALGAVIYAVFGLGLALFVNAASFLISAISETFIRVPRQRSISEKKNFRAFKNDVREGIKLIRTDHRLLTTVRLAAIVNFAISPLFSVGFIYVIREILGASDYQYGIFQTAIAASMIVGALFLGAYIRRHPVGSVLKRGLVLLTTMILLMALFTTAPFIDEDASFYLAFSALTVLSFFSGLIVVMVNVAIGTFIQNIVPSEFMSRTSAVLQLVATVLIPLGQVTFGFLYDYLPPSSVILISGAIIGLAILWFYRALSRFTNETIHA
ncbi:MAG: MFS transporter [Acholeplasmataceae bacterium]